MLYRVRRGRQSEWRGGVRYIERSFYFSLRLWCTAPAAPIAIQHFPFGWCGICASFVPFLCIYYKKLKRYHSRCKTPIKLMPDIRLCIYFNFLLFEYIVRARVDVHFFYLLGIPLILLVCCGYLSCEHPHTNYDSIFSIVIITLQIHKALLLKIVYK